MLTCDLVELVVELGELRALGHDVLLHEKSHNITSDSNTFVPMPSPVTL
jgi:hypothetical protein